jgi:hypothetical protein
MASTRGRQVVIPLTNSATITGMRNAGSGRFERVALASRFWSKVERTNGCWIWRGTRMHQGYGMFWADGHTRRAHRVAYELNVGPIPVGQQVCHTCDNPACVRPDHLFLGTQQDNMTDKVRKGRAAVGNRNGASTRPETRARGERHGMARLNWTTVLAIRAASEFGASGASIARKFDLSTSQVHRILHGQSWKAAA